MTTDATPAARRRKNAASATSPNAPSPARRERQADPVPEQQPWLTPEDAAGWRTVYVGAGQPREVPNIVELELSPQQWNWVDRAAEAADLTLQAFLAKLVDDARAIDERREGRAKRRAG